MSKAPANKRSIALTRLDLFCPAVGAALSGQYDAFDVVLCQLMMEYEHGIVSVVETHGFDVIDVLAVMSVNILRILSFFFLFRVTAERDAFCEHPFRRELCYTAFCNLHLYALIPVIT